MAYYDLGEYEKSLKCCDEGLKIKNFDWLYENKIKALDEVIATRAQERAEEAFEKIKSRKQKIAENTELNIENLIDEMAKKILDENRTYIGKEAVEKSKEVIESEAKERKGGKGANEEKAKKTRRTSKQ